MRSNSRAFMRELESCLDAGRPCIVIDCSKVQMYGPQCSLSAALLS